MSRWIKVDGPINRYIVEHLEPESPVLQALCRETAGMEGAQMQISHEQARFMTVLLKSLQAKRTLEVGVYTGYSTLITATALPADGKVIACDISAEWTAMAKRYWQEAGVADRIDLRLAPAQDTMRELLATGEAGTFDFVFIDADKTGYDSYYELALQLLRPGGMIALDNCLWNGSVVDLNDHDEDTVAIRALNDKIALDRRVNSYLAPVGDGVYLCCKM
ncbi:MAG: class I SAM-dependent methyltransferase [Gammaproteobacteria bacterium]|nr:class I SAM-dependent methyltransferase [Gammaproteobacteria bacterium]MDP2142471.1 class I SAM-dependent methyltransferase [Gammaproteobacteria bacterium]MDP2346470.1 class I SAM-dependent methyltransferase [Gammaproteobacteria bacterium]